MNYTSSTGATRNKAIFLAIFFHAILIAALSFSSASDSKTDQAKNVTTKTTLEAKMSANDGDVDWKAKYKEFKTKGKKKGT
ncbi:MAG: hypothetical protein KA974_08680 [Saprospiraceae bacterium]|nr:hypothetical protein [Saprospiraceae bacterium]MBP7699114.1 hypothetical protein [Saprospiraceae bacterium]